MTLTLLLALAVSAQPVDASQAKAASDGLQPLVGHWTCQGHFVKSCKKIASTLAIARDDATQSLVIHHDDSAPAQYHSLEVWKAKADGSGFKAAIADTNGMRWLASYGWQHGTLAWDRTEDAVLVERFSYTPLGPSRMRVDWSVARDGQALTLGDTLSCDRDDTSNQDG